MSEYAGAPHEDFYKQAMWLLDKFGPLSHVEFYEHMWCCLAYFKPGRTSCYFPRDVDAAPYELQHLGVVTIGDKIAMTVPLDEAYRMLAEKRAEYAAKDVGEPR